MSDIYIPELIELDSYWQKAVEDAIYDTLKGEKRLYYALKNRKKINKKLEKLGLKPAYSQMSFSGRCHFSVNSVDSSENLNFEKLNSGSNTDWGSCDDPSLASLVSNRGKPDARANVDKKAAQNPIRCNLSLTPVKSGTTSHDGRTPPEHEYRNPERPILGNASLEKMKKSQNSFCCEPMGKSADSGPFEVDGSMPRANLNLGTNGEPVKSEFLRRRTRHEKKAKTIRWLHVRKGGDFDDSDTETSNNGPMKEKRCQEKKVNASRSKLKKIDPVCLPLLGNKLAPMTLDPRQDQFWEKEVKNAIRENANLERKLYFALAKRHIMKETRRASGNTRRRSREIMVHPSEATLAAKKRESKKFLSPFVKFYLEVYRELCSRHPVEKIYEEAASRWLEKSLKWKSRSQNASRNYSKTTQKKG